MERKELGQVFTPINIVREILDNIGYTSDSPNILVKKIIEPSFGRGVFLLEILDRLIAAAKNFSISSADLEQIISENVWGIEYDLDLYKDTFLELNNYLSSHNLRIKKWNLYNQDALAFTHFNEFDYVIGNPPYIRLHNMDSVLRQSVKQFSMSHGTTDLYIIFFEHGVNLLNASGRLAYISPNSYLKNSSQSKFRKYLLENNLIDKIVDFGSKIIFDDAATYTAITYLNKNKKSANFIYESSDRDGKHKLTLSLNEFKDGKDFIGDPWTFTTPAKYSFLTNITSRKKKLSDLINVRYGVNTLRNKLFTNIDNKNIELAISRPAVKGSNHKGGASSERILFPYELNKITNKYIPITEYNLKSLYPNAYSYLLENKEELLMRDMDKEANWYQYGRSQGLSDMNLRKLTFSHIISPTQKRIIVSELDSDTIVYSGIFITEISNGLNLSEIKEILEGEEFCEFAKLSGKDLSGGFKSFNTKIIKNYAIN